jgi:hypothetical protein
MDELSRWKMQRLSSDEKCKWFYKVVLL